jgi:hypothetical protein
MSDYMWLLPAWLLGAPLILGLIEYFRLPRHLKTM